MRACWPLLTLGLVGSFKGLPYHDFGAFVYTVAVLGPCGSLGIRGYVGLQKNCKAAAVGSSAPYSGSEANLIPEAPGIYMKPSLGPKVFR